MFNLQSGIHRQRYPAPLSPVQARKLKLEQLGAVEIVSDNKKKFSFAEEKHSKAVTGIAVDDVNRTIVSCGLDGKLKVSML
jgi:U3 small nucleolar RNA-associated protein 21